MFEFLKTSAGVYNVTFILAILGWLVSGVGIFAGFHLTKVRSVEAESKAKRAELQRVEMAGKLETSEARTAELEHRLAPRMLTEEQRDKLVHALAELQKSEICFVHVTLQPETVLFLRQIQSAFVAAGFSTPEKPEYNLSYSIPAPDPWFIAIVVGTGEQNPLAIAIQRAFKQAGIDAMGAVCEDSIVKPGAFKIYIGSK